MAGCIPRGGPLPSGTRPVYCCTMQLNTETGRPPSGPGGTSLPAHDATLAQDAEAFSRALERLARVYQLQDPRQTCSFGISLTECYSLETLVLRGPVTVNDVAGELGLDKSTASRALAGLARKGLARRRLHPEDGRAVSVSATPAGQRLFERIRRAGRSLNREILGDFSPGDRRAATAVLQRVAAAETACASTGCGTAA